MVLVYSQRQNLPSSIRNLILQSGSQPQFVQNQPPREFGQLWLIVAQDEILDYDHPKDEVPQGRMMIPKDPRSLGSMIIIFQKALGRGGSSQAN